jgi:hypothetical protein
MAWDINDRGTIDLTPLVDWEAGIILETGCGLRLLFARHKEMPQIDRIVVQTVLTVEQAAAIAQALQQMVGQILQPGPAPH